MINNYNNKQNKLKEKRDKIDLILKKVTNEFCNIGIKKVIKHLSIKNDEVSKIIKLILKIEYLNLSAKVKENNNNKYKYKELLIFDLIYLCEKNKINYGFLPSDILNANSLIFFDFSFGQISWHSMVDYKKQISYIGKWDKKELSTFDKIEDYIVKNNFL